MENPLKNVYNFHSGLYPHSSEFYHPVIKREFNKLKAT